MPTLTESTLEQATLEWLTSLGYTTAFGPSLAPGEAAAERDTLLPRLMSGEVRVKDVEL